MSMSAVPMPWRCSLGTERRRLSDECCESLKRTFDTRRNSWTNICTPRYWVPKLREAFLRMYLPGRATSLTMSGSLQTSERNANVATAFKVLMLRAKQQQLCPQPLLLGLLPILRSMQISMMGTMLTDWLRASQKIPAAAPAQSDEARALVLVQVLVLLTQRHARSAMLSAVVAGGLVWRRQRRSRL